MNQLSEREGDRDCRREWTVAIWSVFYIVACLKQAVVPVRDWPGMVTEVGSFLVQAGPRGSVRKSLQKNEEHKSK